MFAIRLSILETPVKVSLSIRFNFKPNSRIILAENLS
jgi:hypothetical protein